MSHDIFEARGEAIARELCQKIAPTCRSCPMVTVKAEVHKDFLNEGYAVNTRVRCNAHNRAPCFPDGLKPDTFKSTKDFGMPRPLKFSEYAHQALIPDSEVLKTGHSESVMAEIFPKVIEQGLLEEDEDVINEWWNLLDNLGGLRRAWRGAIKHSWFEAKKDYVEQHMIHVKRNAASGTCDATPYMTENLPKDLQRPFTAVFESPKDMRPGRVVHPGSRPSDKKYTPPPPPKYHNWGTWGS